MKRLVLLGCLVLVAILAASCREDSFSPGIAKSGVDPLAGTVTLPAGSVDALAAAIAAAGPHGTVWVESGSHAESAGVLITAPVNILGEPGAILRIATATSSLLPAPLIDVALHVLGADGTRVEGLEILPASGSIGGVAILVERANHVQIRNNTIREHELGVLVHKGDHTAIIDNEIHASPAWLTGEIAEADGIICMNGNFAVVRGNTVSDALIGIFPSGSQGTASKNTVTGCFAGFVLCNVPSGAFALPGSGEVVGSEESCNLWQIQDNLATNNFRTGYLVIDGANNNRLTNNAASGNALYDIEMAGESLIFGFPTPTCFDNSVKLGKHKDLVVKDCGVNNRVLPAFINAPGPCE